MYYIVAEDSSGLNIAVVVALDFFALGIAEHIVRVDCKHSIAASMRRSLKKTAKIRG